MNKAQFILPLLLASWGCNQVEQTPFNEIDRLRILGLKADDPILQPNRRTTFTALVAPRTVGDAVSYEWQWCPFTSGQSTGYECALSREELQAIVDESSPISLDVPDYRLGTSTTANFTYDLPRGVFQGICDALQNDELPALADLPDCDGTFPVSIRLTVTSTVNVDGETETQRVEAVRDLALAYAEDVAPNNNPVLGRLFATELDEEGAGVGAEFEITAEGPNELKRDVTYELRNDITEDQSETFLEVPPEGGAAEMVREQLSITWFIDDGDTRFTRTGFLPGLNELETLQKNEFTPPRSVDYPQASLRLFLVGRDGRGGNAFMSRIITLVAP